MPSSLHQTLVDLLRHAPSLVPSLLRAAGAATTVESVRPLDAVLDQLERRVDLAMEVYAAGLGRVAVGFEVQLAVDADKLRSWPVYLTTLRTPRCPRALLVVLTPDPHVASWAARAIDLGPGNEGFRVHVIGPDQIPRITEAKQARREPELAVLSALAHGEDPRLVRVALAGLEGLDSARAWSYGSVLLKALDGAVRADLEVNMQEREIGATEEDDGSGVTPEFVARALRFGRWYYEEELRRDAARDRALEQGLEQGRAQGHREVLLRLLARARLRPTPAEAQRIETCSDLALLDRWIDQSITASSVDEALSER